MRMSLTEFRAAIERLKTLKGQDRAALLAHLRSVKVFDTDTNGNEFDVEVDLVEKSVMSIDDGEGTAGDFDSLTTEQKAAAMKALNAAHIRAGRKTLHIGTPKSAYAVPDRARHARVKNFKAYDQQDFTPGERAFRFGQFVRAAAGRPDAKRWCAENGVVVRLAGDDRDEGMVLKDQVEFDNSRGGVLVPPEFDTDLINLREEFGTIRQFARNVNMTSETKTRMRRTGGLVARHVAEQEAGQKSTKTWDAVNLVARKVMAIAIMSNELDADSAVNLGDDLAQEIAYAFAEREDDDGFNGDGSSPYGGIVGIRQRLIDVYGIDGGPGLVVASGNLWSEITLRDLQTMTARLPVYAGRPDTAWYVSNAFWGTVMQPLALATTGTDSTQVVNGVRTPMFLGYPVRIVQKMPATQANSQVAAVFGSLPLAVDFGDRAGTTIKISEEGVVEGVSLFETDQMAIRGTERFDINVHSVGDENNAGPIVGLITAAS